MKNYLPILLLITLSFASFSLQSADITISLNKDDSAHVIETFNLLVPTQFDVDLYNNLLSYPDDLASWSSKTKISEIRLHIDRTYGNVSNLRILPQPLKCNPLSNICTGTLILEYDVYSYSTKNDTGLFFVENYKPRTKKYTLNEKVFSFLRDKAGNIVLDEKTRLIFKLPENSKILFLNPLTSQISSYDFPVSASTVSWKNTVLVKFGLVFEVEGSILDEIQEFFSLAEKTIMSLIFSSSSVFIFIMIAVPFITYIYLDYKKKNKKR